MKGEMEKHMQEALVINRERAPKYGELSGGRSLPLHKKLILGEWICTYTSKLPDLWARYFQKRGVPIFKEDFIPMANIKNFSQCFPFEPQPLTSFKKRNIRNVVRELKKSYQVGSHAGLSGAVQAELNYIEEIKTYHHMYRHVLESLRRVANLAPLHQKLAKQKGLFFNPIWLSNYLLWSHLLVLPSVYKLDEELAPIQADNIPVLYNDLPYVPPHSTFYQ